jgi:hypothetical protein
MWLEISLRDENGGPAKHELIGMAIRSGRCPKVELDRRKRQLPHAPGWSDGDGAKVLAAVEARLASEETRSAGRMAARPILVDGSATRLRTLEAAHDKNRAWNSP